MMSRYRISSQARIDLKDIYRYIAQDNPKSAGKLRDLFFERFRMLSRQPLLGESCEELLPDLRFFSAGKYIIFYKPSQEGITILRVLHGARDIETLFDIQ